MKSYHFLMLNVLELDVLSCLQHFKKIESLDRIIHDVNLLRCRLWTSKVWQYKLSRNNAVTKVSKCTWSLEWLVIQLCNLCWWKLLKNWAVCLWMCCSNGDCWLFWLLKLLNKCLESHRCVNARFLFSIFNLLLRLLLGHSLVFCIEKGLALYILILEKHLWIPPWLKVILRDVPLQCWVCWKDLIVWFLNTRCWIWNGQVLFELNFLYFIALKQWNLRSWFLSETIFA